MRKLVIFVMLAISVGLFSGCAITPTTPALGLIYKDMKYPVEIGGGAGSFSKVGTAQAKTYVGLVAVGDASVDAAMKNGGIRKIHHVDYQVKNILFFYGEVTTIVYGE